MTKQITALRKKLFFVSILLYSSIFSIPDCEDAVYRIYSVSALKHGKTLFIKSFILPAIQPTKYANNSSLP
jgi:hypothetical protein